MSGFRHKLTKVGPQWYRIQMKAAGEHIGVMKAGGSWHLIHPRLGRDERLMHFRAARDRALALAKVLDGES